jgi:enoyl reductase-like protein
MLELFPRLGTHTRRVPWRVPWTAMGRRLNVTLDDERAAKLARLAERMHVQEGTLARSLLATALDEADPDPRTIATLLDAIPGAYERAQLGAEQARRGNTVALDDLE